MSTRKMLGGLMLFVLMTCFGLAAYAGAAVDAGGVSQLTLGAVFAKGGRIMYVLAAMSVAGMALVIYYFFVLRAEQAAPRGFVREVTGKLAAGSWTDVREACTEQPCALAEVVLAGLDYVENVPQQETMMLKEVIESEGARQGVEIQTQPQFLLDLAILSPMVGLLGSVFGMFGAFNAVALDVAKAKPIELAGGVAEALIATAGGLIIGIPAMAFYGYFRNRASRVVSKLEGAAGEVLTAFLKGRK